MSISMLADIPATVTISQQSMLYAGAFCALGFAAIGSAYGTGAATSAAVGAWKKCYAQNKPAPFQLLIFAGAPLSQTIYGMILMFLILGAETPEYGMAYLIVGILAGIAMGISAAWQGITSASACDAFADTNKGFANQIMVIGIVETVAIFVMAFAIVLLGSFAPIKANEVATGFDPATAPQNIMLVNEETEPAKTADVPAPAEKKDVASAPAATTPANKPAEPAPAPAPKAAEPTPAPAK